MQKVSVVIIIIIQIVGYNYYVGDVTDSHVSYEAIVMLNDKAVVGTNYSFNALMKMANGALSKGDPIVLDIATADVAPAVVRYIYIAVIQCKEFCLFIETAFML